MPYYEGKKIGDETPLYRRWGPWILLVLGIAALAVLVVSLLGGEDEAPPSTAPTTSSTTNTTVATTTTSSSTTTSTTLALVAGQPCTAGIDRDCIDPEENGSYVYLPGGAACLESTEDPRDCADNDGDGRPGPPLAATT